MAKAVVFVSSNIAAPESFLAERHVAKTVIESFPCFDAWVFETTGASSQPLEASYLEPLRTAAIVVVILGQHLTTPVQREYSEATTCGKRIIMLLKDVTARDPAVDALITAANVKYARFSTLAEFEEELRKALMGEIARAFQQPLPERTVSRTERQLRKLLAANRPVSFRPTFPPNFTNDTYLLETLDADELVAKKGSGHVITVPLEHVTMGAVGSGGNTVLQVIGRVQWDTIQKYWRYLPEPPRDDFGVPKPSSPGEKRSVEVQGLLAARHAHAQWNFEAQATHGRYQVVYDEDGYYFRCKGRDPRGDQILVVHA